MRTVLQFTMSGTEYCLPVDSTRAVRSAAGMIALPAPSAQVAGLIAGDPPLTVVSPFGMDGQRIIVVQAGDLVYGLLVDVVTGLRRIDETCVRAAPRGQDREIICGTIDVDGQLLLLTDPTAMAAGI
jgi:chemotaxis signal transduction protein